MHSLVRRLPRRGTPCPARLPPMHTRRQLAGGPRRHALLPSPSRAARITAQVITRFSGGEHQLLLPLWPGDGEVDQSKTLANLRRWHQERFGGDGARLSGKHLESPEDRTAWDDLSP